MPFLKQLFITCSLFFLFSACTTDPASPPPIPSPTNAPITTHLTKTTIPTPTMAATPIGGSTFAGVRINFIYFEGFLITVGDQRILIDALYKVHPRDVLNPILDSQPPFDGVDVILTTHEHSDHFDPELVSQYLQNNPMTKFVSTPKCVDAILALDNSLLPRLTAIDLEPGESKQLVINDISIEAIRLSHGIAGVLNLGFIVTIDDLTFFHMGDMNPSKVSVFELQSYGLPGKQIDIAFIHHRLFSEEKYHNHILKGISATYLIPMHFSGKPPLDFESSLPNVIVIREPYDSWEMP